jgi:hypothetical protein
LDRILEQTDDKNDQEKRKTSKIDQLNETRDPGEMKERYKGDQYKTQEHVIFENAHDLFVIKFNLQFSY